MKRTLVIWGAGRIGRGFVADIFDSPAWHTAFVDIDKALVDALNARGEYTITKATKDGVTRKTINNGFTAYNTDETDKLKELFLAPGLMLDIAVHAPVMPAVADMLKPLIIHRAETGAPMDVMLNVNMHAPDARFDELMRARLEGEALEYYNKYVGVSGIFAMCISPMTPDELLKRDPLALWNNGYPEQAIDAGRLKNAPPELPRLRLTRDVEREETRKLYTLNMAHAFACYMGLPLGLKTAREAATDARLRPKLVCALNEAGVGLSGEYGFGADEMRAWAETILALLENPYIDDELKRLGADARRKLGARDRLAGPARLCLKHGGAPVSLCAAIRAGFDYENDDEGTRCVREYVKARGLSAALREFCDIDPDDALGKMILKD